MSVFFIDRKGMAQLNFHYAKTLTYPCCEDFHPPPQAFHRSKFGYKNKTKQNNNKNLTLLDGKNKWI